MRGEIVRRCCLVEKAVSKSQILSDGDIEPSIIVRGPPIEHRGRLCILSLAGDEVSTQTLRKKSIRNQRRIDAVVESTAEILRMSQRTRPSEASLGLVVDGLASRRIEYRLTTRIKFGYWLTR